MSSLDSKTFEKLVKANSIHYSQKMRWYSKEELDKINKINGKDNL